MSFRLPTLIMMSAMMFIGASPSSVGRNSYGDVCIKYSFPVLLRQEEIRRLKSFAREIHEDDIIKSVAVSMLAVIICSISLLILSITEHFLSLSLFLKCVQLLGQQVYQWELREGFLISVNALL